MICPLAWTNYKFVPPIMLTYFSSTLDAFRFDGPLPRAPSLSQ